MKKKKVKMKEKIKTKKLIDEIERFGYSISVKTLLFTYAGVVIGAVAAGYLFNLRMIWYFVIGIVALYCTPRIIYQIYKAMYEQRRFSDSSQYLEKMIYYFSSSEKILDSLKATIIIFPVGRMHDVLQSAIDVILTSTDSDVERQALNIIEEAYPTLRIKTLHNFMIDVEYNGGSVKMGTKMLLNDRARWVDRTIELQNGKKNLKRDTIISSIIVLALAVFIIYLPDFIPSVNVSISDKLFVQLSSVMILCVIILNYVSVNKTMSKNWMDNKTALTDEECEKKYFEYVNYDFKKQFTYGLICSCVTAVIGIVMYAFTESIICYVMSGLLILFFLLSHKIGYRMLEKEITKLIETNYPAWLLKVSLYLQTENVPMALTKSYASAPGIVKPGLKKMLMELNEDPVTAAPYNNFLSEFHVSEIHESMTALYALSQATGGDIEHEFEEIIRRNDNLTDKAEKIANEDKIFYMQRYIFYPGLACSIKMLVDCTVLFLTFFNATGNLV